ncbi:MAG: NFACT RNA binding domain-containing protein [Eubacteriales bacterium]|nr:NFACT RNA binding domain-containing protein [Eubacteriales bacterium]
MPMDGFMLGLIARELNETLAGARVDKITQPEPDELVLALRCPGENKNLLLSANAGAARVQTTTLKRPNPLEPSSFCMLLRKRIAGSRIRSITQHQGDRILDITFDAVSELGDPCLLTITAECMGRHSNLIFYDQNERILESARHVPMDVSSVRQVLPGLRYERPPLQDKLPREGLNAQELGLRLGALSGLVRKALSKTIMGLSEQTSEELALHCAGSTEAVLEECDLSSLCARAVEWLESAPERIEPIIYKNDEGMPVDICPFPYQSRSHFQAEACSGLCEAMDAYYTARDDMTRIQQKATSLRHLLKRNIERCEKKLALRLQTLKDSEHMEEYRIKGELLNASIAMVPKGARSISLPNWYDENCAEIEIQLDESMSPARNAQRYFKLYQKMRNAAHMAGEQAAETREELAYLENQLQNLEKSTDEADLQEIRAELEKEGYVHATHNRRQKKALPESKPLRFLSRTGKEIFVGKNNVQNEKLTFSAGPMEIWLHAKDMPGSHVILKSTEPDDLSLMDAAMLAAYYSKGQSSSNVPVDMTQRRYVKKPAGAKPGYVIFTHNTTVYVTPSEQAVRALLPENAAKSE